MTQGCVVAKLLDKCFETGDTRFCVAADIIDRIVGTVTWCGVAVDIIDRIVATVHLVLCCCSQERLCRRP